MQNLKDRLEKLADSFKGTTNSFGRFTVTNVGCGILRVDGEGVQYTPDVILGFLNRHGIK